jgi:hypothetical protein
MYSVQGIFQHHFQCNTCALYSIKYSNLLMCVWQNLTTIKFYLIKLATYFLWQPRKLFTGWSIPIDEEEKFDTWRSHDDNHHSNVDRTPSFGIFWTLTSKCDAVTPAPPWRLYIHHGCNIQEQTVARGTILAALALSKMYRFIARDNNFLQSETTPIRRLLLWDHNHSNACLLLLFSINFL